MSEGKKEINYLQDPKTGEAWFLKDGKLEQFEFKAITPSWLESKGFVLITEDNQKDIPGAWDLDLGVNMDEGSLCYLENKLDRKQFAIKLTPSEDPADEMRFRWFEVLIRDDIGCGFVEIPNQFSEMTEYHFSLLYEAIRREKL